jgi:uncharacterized iron-regulated membrane protein
MLKLSLQLHKWIALIVGVQVLFWVVGGLVMTAIPIERVRSEHHLAERKPSALPLAAVLTPQEAAARARVTPVEATLKTSPRGPVWVFKTAAEETVETDARSGARLGQLGEAEARSFAAQAYTGDGRPVAARFYDEAPQETGREGPLWRVDFDDAERTAFYLDPETGEVVTRRSAVWRFYDFWWRLHILDLKNGEDFNHPLLIALTALTLPMVITGIILLWIRLSRDWSNFRRRRARA